jgi:hypothetical protein
MWLMWLLAAGGARDRNRTGTPAIHEAADFKSAVSTYFTTRAEQQCLTHCETKKPLANLNARGLMEARPGVEPG